TLGLIYNSHIINSQELGKKLEGYFFEHKLVDKRIDEQVATGSIVVDKDGYITMTQRGQRIVKMECLNRQVI
ncbi:MAG: hypothetical protein LBE13_22875, partial [Bacteroidales bacterium]|nr:hypothetical protein [Bacteroidales bacterium]